ncbi:T9SS type A sorting domain-containing protein [Aureisphaera galaxeae]|uniref:T9SS type A sorting domain-containing protein n=1 Tax=Aureisphaera galaxeae TaxID=1538023 RepID=UPI00234FC33C|nr:T9SS type A sorting domain-containing protein [Aureisphaera galaxeae]MDC8005151.1 T9SS type A sorting domain-containing protein [Aureisphaera galaxeae]
MNRVNIKIFICLIAFFVTSVGVAQNNPITFEAGEFGADWTWTVFENGTNPPLEIIANPDPSGINTSATVAKFTALQEGAPFAGVESMHGADIGTFTLTADNAIVRVKVWKSVISDVGVKFATLPGASTGELKVPNTVVNAWEELVFDFTSIIGEPSSTDIDQIIVFPDFDARTSDNIIYFDDISFSDSVLDVSDLDESTITAYPNPMDNYWTVKANDALQKITIYNISGQVIKTQFPDTTQHMVDVSDLLSGIYFAKVVSLSGETTLKLIKN